MSESVDEDFIPTALTLGPLALPRRHPLGLPVVANVQLFAYKRDLVGKHGLNHAPATWSELLEAARILARRSWRSNPSFCGELKSTTSW